MTKNYIKNWLIENHSNEVLKLLREKNFKLYLKQLVHSSISSEDLDYIVKVDGGYYNAAKTPDEVEDRSEGLASALVLYLNKESLYSQISAVLKDHPDVIQSLREFSL